MYSWLKPGVVDIIQEPPLYGSRWPMAAGDAQLETKEIP